MRIFLRCSPIYICNEHLKLFIMKKIVLLFALVLSGLAIAQTPIYNWVNQSGAAGNDDLNRIAVDALENVYTAERSVGNLLISKINAAGATMWTKTISGNYETVVRDIKLDSQGNILLVGIFSSQVDFDPGTGVFNLGVVNYSQSPLFSFLLKLNPAGEFIFAKKIGGSPVSITTDSTNAICITGSFSNSADFDPSPVVNNTQTSLDGYSMFVTKLNSSGEFVWNKVIGKTTISTSGFGTVQGSTILTDANNGILISGSFTDDVDFDLGTGITSYNSGGSAHTANPFILKLTQNGDFVWAKYFESNENSFPKGMAIDATGAIYTTGVLQGFMDFDSSAATLYLNHTYQLVPYVSKMDSSGNIIWAKKIFSTDYNVELKSIKLDQAGTIFTLGTFKNTVNYTTLSGAGTATVSGAYSQNIFLTALNSNGILASFNHFGGTTSISPNDFVINNSNAYISGNFNQTVDFDMSNAVQNRTSNGLQDNFVAKYSNLVLSSNNFENKTLKLSLFPNPCSNLLNITVSALIESASIKIISIAGQTVLEKNNQNGTDFILDVTHLTKGVYLVQITDSTSSTTSKFIKQ